jgi:hypothetical protein
VPRELCIFPNLREFDLDGGHLNGEVSNVRMIKMDISTHIETESEHAHCPGRELDVDQGTSSVRSWIISSPEGRFAARQQMLC